jgi:transcriptional regulator with XRE-family HTH domain
MKFDFERFYRAVDAKRTQRAASWRQVAREIGVGKSTLARMSQNKRPDADGLAALSYWAQVNPADFVLAEVRHAEPPAYRSGDCADCPAPDGGAVGH